MVDFTGPGGSSNRVRVAVSAAGTPSCWPSAGRRLSSTISAAAWTGPGRAAGAADGVVEEIKANGGAAVAEYSSVATPEGGTAIVQKALDEFGRIDVVVNNAGILRDKAFHNMEVDQITAVLDVHLRGSFYVTEAAWPHCGSRGTGESS